MKAQLVFRLSATGMVNVMIPRACYKAGMSQKLMSLFAQAKRRVKRTKKVGNMTVRKVALRRAVLAMMTRMLPVKAVMTSSLKAYKQMTEVNEC